MSKQRLVAGYSGTRLFQMCDHCHLWVLAGEIKDGSDLCGACARGETPRKRWACDGCGRFEFLTPTVHGNLCVYCCIEHPSFERLSGVRDLALVD